MKIDCHVHTRAGAKFGSASNYDTDVFASALSKAGFDGAAIYSPSPLSYSEKHWSERMQICIDMCKKGTNLFPFYYIDPSDEDAEKQVIAAIDCGYVAFKMIPQNYTVKDKSILRIISKIAEAGKPIIFHTGICWDKFASADNHRPTNYEALLAVPNLRFCLAHVSWPWYNECIALYGKFQWLKRTDPALPEMFIDVTPGTPKVYRDEVFRHMLLSYDMRHNLMFGSDCNTDNYDAAHTLGWQNTDNELYAKYIDNNVEDFKENVYGKNFLRFIGVSQ